MRTLMRIPRRYLLFVVIATVLLISVISIAATRRASAITPVDCASDCAANRDKTLEKCDELPETARDKCKDRAQKQYDKCIQRCNGGGGGDSSPGGF
jgi:hypothetical protein